MNGSGKAGNGRGNKNRRPFRRSSQDSDFYLKGNGVSPKTDNTPENDNFHRNKAFQKKNHGRPQNSDNQNRQNRGAPPKDEKAPFYVRPKWVPPVPNTSPLPVPDCPWCGKPIRDISSAIADKDTGVPVHFDCVAAKIASGENLEKGDIISYIGGGRFGIVSFGGKDSQERTGSGFRGPVSEFRDFKIKKIIEWENKDKKAEWRSEISDHYLVI